MNLFSKFLTGQYCGEIEKYQHWTTPLLQELVASEDSNSKQKLHASLALVKDDPSQVDFLFQRLLSANADDVPVIVTFLKPHKEKLKKRLWNVVKNGSNSERIRASAALAAYDSNNEQWKQVCEDVVTALVSVSSSESDEWIAMFRPVGSVLAVPLERRFTDRSTERNAERPLAALVLADYLKDAPKRLTELMLLADNDREFHPLMLALRNHKQTVVPELQSLLRQSARENAVAEDRDGFWKKQANAAVCLLELGEPKLVWPLFQQTPDPSLRSFLIDRIALLGANHESLVAQIKLEPNPASRYAQVLALGHFDLGKMSSQQKQELVDQLASLYRDDPDLGVHSAAGWTLRNWQQDQIVTEIDTKLKKSLPKKGRNWFINSQGQTFAVVNGPVEFLIGEKTERTEPRKVTLSHGFAIATREVTVAQFQKFRSNHKHSAGFAPKPDCPVNMVSWYDAVAYCNWLSEQEGIPKDQWCYQPNEKGEYAEGMKIPADYLERTGYRLPTDEEWEYGCRANSKSTYGFGEPVDLLTRYGWYVNNSESHMWPVGTKLPNCLGMFDMHGNAFEWCHSLFGAQNRPSDVVVKKGDSRVLRGGSFFDLSSIVRSANRHGDTPQGWIYNLGFRLSRTYNLAKISSKP